MPVVVTAVFHPLDERRDDLVAALRESIPAVHDEEGCMLYAIHDAADGTITMIEKWQTPESLQAHSEGAAVTALEAAVGPHLARPTTVTTMEPRGAGSTAKGQL